MPSKRVILGLFVLAGCASDPSGFTSDDPPGPSRTSAAEADVPDDASTDAGAPSGDGAAPEDEPVLLSWSFEPASADCNGWPALGGTGIRAAPPRTGAYSCKVCSDGSTPAIDLARDLGAVPPGRYVLRAWVRERERTKAPAHALARLEADTAGGPVRAAGPSSAVRADWEALEVTLELSEPASNLRVVIGAPEADEKACLFVDDVTVVRTP